MLDRLRERVESLLLATAQERYRSSTAQLRKPELGALLSRYDDLFDLERLSEVQLRLAEARGDDEKRLRYLLEYLVRGRARGLVGPELGTLQVWRSMGSLTIGERRIPVRAVRPVVAGLADATERHAVADRYFDALQDHESGVEELLSRHRDVVEEVGSGGYLNASEVLTGIDLQGLARGAEGFLRDTEAVHAELLDWYLPRLTGVARPDAREADAWRLAAAAPTDRWLPHAPDAAVQRILAETGLDPFAEGRIKVDAALAVMPDVEAQCHLLDVPHDVRLVASPARTLAAQHHLLCAFGCALHGGYTDPDLPLELRWLGDSSVPRAFGLLVAGLLHLEPFIARTSRGSRADTRDRVRLGALLDLVRARRDAAQLVLEVEVLAPTFDPHVLREEYAPRLTLATGFRHDARGALWNVRPGFSIARRVRAEQLAAVLARWLRERFDHDWFRNPAAGPALRTLLASGRHFDATELALQLRSVTLSYDDVCDRVREAVG